MLADSVSWSNWSIGPGGMKKWPGWKKVHIYIWVALCHSLPLWNAGRKYKTYCFYNFISLKTYKPLRDNLSQSLLHAVCKASAGQRGCLERAGLKFTVQFTVAHNCRNTLLSMLSPSKGPLCEAYCDSWLLKGSGYAKQSSFYYLNVYSANKFNYALLQIERELTKIPFKGPYCLLFCFQKKLEFCKGNTLGRKVISTGR